MIPMVLTEIGLGWCLMSIPEFNEQLYKYTEFSGRILVGCTHHGHIFFTPVSLNNFCRN